MVLVGHLSNKILDIGCGRKKLAGSIGLDRLPLEGVDVVHDLNQYPYPFPKDTFDFIRLSHVIEHVSSVLRTMEEVYRIARDGAEVEIVTPHYTDASSWQDPTHTWHLNSGSFDFFQQDHQSNYYSEARFQLLSCEIKLLKLFKFLGFECLVNLGNRFQHFRKFRSFWEQYLCFVIRGKVMTFRLKVLKPPGLK
jgi:SAM-dependent methyltransferase